MLLAEMVGALICYAGSAPKASIGSKPIGAELETDKDKMSAQSQVLVEMVSESGRQAICGSRGQ
jgi:hypothetical protein